MPNSARPAARGSRSARRVQATERERDFQLARGVLRDPELVRAEAEAEAGHCPYCEKLVHPSNWADHMKLYHEEEWDGRLPGRRKAAVELKIDDEFRDLIPALTAEEDEALEASLKADGCRDALVVWDETSILLDGHNRYRICQEHGLAFTTVRKSFADRQDALIWVIQNQFGRRNLTPFMRSELALKLEDVIAAKAKANLVTSTGGKDPQPLMNSAKAEPVNTRAEIAHLADTSEDTIRKVKTVTTKAPEPIKRAARAGDIAVDRAYRLTKALEGAAPEVVDLAMKVANDEPEKIEILKRLHRSAGSPTSNGTFDEINTTGGFAYGDDMEAWCNFKEANIQVIQKALKSIEEHHRRLVADERRAEKEAAKAIPDGAAGSWRIFVGDITGGLPSIEDESVDFVITDPPYGAEHLALYGALSRLSRRVLKDGGSLLVMIGQSYLPEAIRQLESALTYHWTHVYWTPGGQSAHLWQRKVNTFWKPVLHFVKGEYSGDWVGDVLRSDTNDNDKRLHKWQQSESGMADLVMRFTYPGQVICDPFCGSGTTGVVAVRMARAFVGVDADESAVKTATERIEACTSAK